MAVTVLCSDVYGVRSKKRVVSRAVASDNYANVSEAELSGYVGTSVFRDRLDETAPYGRGAMKPSSGG